MYRPSILFGTIRWAMVWNAVLLWPRRKPNAKENATPAATIGTNDIISTIAPSNTQWTTQYVPKFCRTLNGATAKAPIAIPAPEAASNDA